MNDSSPSVPSPWYVDGRTIEPIAVCDDWALNYCEGSILKYMARAGNKPGETDADDWSKIVWCANHEYQRRRGFQSEQGAETAKAAPGHYRDKVITPIEIIEAYDLSYQASCAVKYMLRAGRKLNGLSQIEAQVKDVAKAIHHLQMELARLQSEGAKLFDDSIAAESKFKVALAMAERYDGIGEKNDES